MEKKIFIGFFAVLFMAALSLASDDHQEYRANSSFSFKLDELWKVKLVTEFHFRDGEHFEQEDEVLFTYKGLGDWIDVGVGYKLVYKEDSSNEWRRENRPFVEATVKKDLWGLKWSDRNRLEYRQKENSPDLFRYRNRLKMQIPYNLFDLPLQPYVADEVFIQEETGMNRNRLIAGLVWDINETLDVDFFYYFQKDKTSSDGWQDLNIIGAELKFSF